MPGVRGYKAGYPPARITPPVHHGFQAPGASPIPLAMAYGPRGAHSMTTTTTTTNRPALNRRALLHRALAGAAGAAIAVPAAAKLATAATTGADPVIALIAEEQRLYAIGERYDG